MMNTISPIPASPAETKGWPSATQGWLTVAAFCVAAILSYTDRQILSLLVDPIRGDLLISDTQIGLLQGMAFAIVYSFAGIPFGRMADRTARRTVVLAGIVVWSLGTLLCGMAGSFGELFAGRLIVGIGEAALAPAATSMIGDLFPQERRGVALGVFMMGMVVGGGVAIGIGGGILTLATGGAFEGLPFIGDLAPWRTALVLLALAGVPLLIGLAFIPEPARRGLAEGGSDGLPLRRTFEMLAALRWRILPLVLGCAMMAVGDFAMLSWAPALLSRNFAMAPGEIGALLGTLIVIAGVISTVGGGYVSDRLTRRSGAIGRVHLAVVACVLALPCSFIWFATGPYQVLALVSLWTMISTVAGVTGIVALQESVPNELRGLSVSFIGFGNILVGLGIGVTMIGFVVDHVFVDPLSLGKALTLCVTPAAIIAIFSFALAGRAIRKASHL